MKIKTKLQDFGKVVAIFIMLYNFHRLIYNTPEYDNELYLLAEFFCYICFSMYIFKEEERR